MKATITPNGDDTFTLTAGVGSMRLLLDQAKQNAQSFVMAPNLSGDLKNRWQKRVTEFGRLLAQLPPPVDPREPYSDEVSGLTSEELREIDPIDPGFIDAVQALPVPASDDLDDLL